MADKASIAAVDGVDPSTVPARRLRSGDRIPAIGLGTFGSDRFSGEDIAAACIGAAEVGYRHFDCASVYGNEHLIGGALEEIQKRGLARKDFWVTSKLWNDKHAEADVIPSCKKTLSDLRLDYLDLYLIHWPFPNSHEQGVDVESRDPHARPYNHVEYMKTWRQLEKLVELGLVRNIGTSNMTVVKLEQVMRDADLKPAAEELEMHPHFQQQKMFDFLTAAGMVPIGFAPIGSPTRPDRDRTETDTVDIEDPVIVRIAKRLNVHPATICVKWAAQRGQVPIPMSVRRNEYLSNIQAVASAPLTDVEMKDLAGIDRGSRLIKGQVFLWPGAASWEQIWD
jgi:alcohol dehydrogenase (NADP+)